MKGNIIDKLDPTQKDMFSVNLLALVSFPVPIKVINERLFTLTQVNLPFLFCPQIFILNHQKGKVSFF